MAQQKSLKLNAILQLVKTFTSLIVPLITFPYSSRILGPVNIGKVNFSTSIIQYFVLIAGLGIGSHGIREIAKVRDDKEKLTKVTGELFSLFLIATAVAYAVFLLCLFFVPKFEEYKFLLVLCSTTIFMVPFGVDFVYNGIENFGYITGRTILFQIINVVSLFLFVKEENDYYQYAAVMVFSGTGANILNFVHLRKFISFRNLFKNLNIRQHLKPVFILFAMSIATQVYKIIDSSMLGFMCSDYEVGLYSAATKINNMVLSIVTAATGILLPRLAYVLKNKGREEFNALALKGIDVLFILALPCTIGLNIVSQNITLALSGDKYLDAVSAMKILNPIIVITGLSGFIGRQLFIPLNKEKWTLISVTAGMVANIAINAFLIPKYGANGAATGTLISESLVTIVQFVMLAKYFSIPLILKKFVVSLFNSVIMGAAVYFISIQIDNIVLNLVLSIFSGAFIYFILLLVEKNQILINIVKAVTKRIKK